MPMPSNKVTSNFVGGEVSELLNARIDLPVYPKSLQIAENFVILPQGAGTFRGGAQLIKNTRLNRKAWYIPFQFSDSQSYLIECTALKARFYTEDGVVLLTATNIGGITNASPGVVTSVAHGYSNGDEIYIDEVEGMTELNGRFFLVANVTADTYTLTEIDGTSVGTAGYGVYSGGGTAAEVYEITTPFTEALLPTLQYCQSADTMYFASRSLKPRKLVRTSHTNWAVSTPTLTADPFGADGSADCPGAVALIDSGRLIFASTADGPETVWGSMAPDPATGATRFENFAVGTDDDDAFVFTLAALQGKVDAIQWITSTNKVIVLGCFGSVRTLYGATFTTPITPTSVTAKSINSLGAARITPVVNGDAVYYVQRGAKVLRSFEYDFTADQYVTTNKNLISQHLTAPGDYIQTVQQLTPAADIVWAVRDDGVLLGLTYHQDEGISGWHRHYLAGDYRDETTKGLTPTAKVLHCGVLPRESGGDQLWLVVEREINSKTVRTIELIADAPAFPRRIDFYTGDEDADRDNFHNALWETQKQAVHLDMAVTYDGSASGAADSISLTPTGTTGTITLTSAVITGTVLVPVVTPTNYFIDSMVGKEIWKKYDGMGGGGGRATITEVIDARTATVEVLQDFDSTEAMREGQWYLTTDEVSGLTHLEGLTVQVVADGGTHNDCTVQDGAITLDYQASVVHAGLKYTGRMTTMNQDPGGITGPAEAKSRSVYRCMIDLLNTLGLKFGTNIYDLVQLDERNATDDLLDRAPHLISGTARVDIQDTPSDTEKVLHFVQDTPLPATLLGYDVFVRTTDEGA